MAEHEHLVQRLAIRVQCSITENTNGLLRQYPSKGTDLSRYTQRELNTIAKRLHNQPRKRLN